MDQNSDGNAAERGASQFFGQHHASKYIHFGTPVLLRVPNAEKSQFAHAPQDLAWDESLIFPGLGVRFDLSLDKTPDLRAQNFVFGAEIGQRAAIVCVVEHRNKLPTSAVR